MRALTGVMKYVGIVLLASVLILAFTVGIMFFVPSVSIFGFYFRQAIQADVVIYNSIDLSDKGFSEITLNIEAGDYHVVILPRESNVIEIRTNNNYIGLVKATEVTKENKNLFSDKYVGMRNEKGQYKTISYDANDDGTAESVTITDEIAEALNYAKNPNYVEGVQVGQKLCVQNPYIVSKDTDKNNNGVFNFTVEEPKGLMSKNASNAIAVYVPVGAAAGAIKYNVNIKTHNGDIRLRNSVDENTGEYEFDFYLGTLDIETNKGNGNLDGVITGDNYLHALGNKAFSKLLLPELNIKTNGGTFDFSNYNHVDVKGPINLESKKAKYVFKSLSSYYNTQSNVNNVYEGSINVTGTNVEFTADKVFCGVDGFSYKSDTGLLKINKLYTGYIPSAVEYVQKYIKNEKGEIVADGTNVEYYVDAKVPYENTIFTESAVIELGTVIGKLGLQNEMGSVDIGHLAHQATIRTENSNINIKTTGYLPDERSVWTKYKAFLGSAPAHVDNVEQYALDLANDKNYKEYTKTSSLILYSTYGDINVGEYYQDAVMHSKKGQITAYSKYSGIKKMSSNLDYVRNGEKIAYYGEGALEDGTKKTTWWKVRETRGAKNIYSSEITNESYLLQLLGSESAGIGQYYSEGVDVAYRINSKWYYDEAGTQEITAIEHKIQLEKKNTGTGNCQDFYFTNVEQSTMRYYYTDITTKDGTVTITTDKNPVRVVASDKATINLTVNGMLNTNESAELKDGGTSITDETNVYMANMNPFGTDGYMYIAETKNGKVNVQLPITSFIVKVNCKTVEGSIGATSDMGEYNKETKEGPEIQINSAKDYQAKVRLTGKKAILSSDV